MKAVSLSPGNWFLLVLLSAIAMTITVTTLAHCQPWLGLSLHWDASRQAAIVTRAEGPAAAIPAGTALTTLRDTRGKHFRLEAVDFTVEPASGLRGLSDYDQLLQRQGSIATLLRTPGGVVLADTEGREYALLPEPYRPIADLPPDFWVQVAVGFFAWLISAGVWIFRRDDQSARYLLLSGLCTLVFTSLAAVYSTRELALPTEQFRWLCDLNFLGGALYCAIMMALLWYYPRPLGRFPLGPVLIGINSLWWLSQELRLIEDMVMARRSLVFANLIGTFVLAGVQWRSTRHDPVARAALQWFLLSWLVGISLFSLLNFVPQVFGVPTGALQGYSFLLFLLVYGGLAFGILRFRLFDLGEWWFRILTWIGGVLLLLLLDMAFLWGLNLSSALSLGLSLLLCGLFWLPFRGWLWLRLMERHRPTERNLFNDILAVTFASHAEERQTRWQALAQQLFDPLQIQALESSPTQVTLDRDGLTLTLPALAPIPALELAYAGAGRRLFTPRDVALATQMLDMLRHASASRDAYHQGVREERGRIARDLHDDIGSTLLTALHHSDPEQSKAAISQGMLEMQTIIRGLAGQRLPLGDILGELRHETGQRLELTGIALAWHSPPPENGLPELGYQVYKNYLSVMRELLANIIRHAGATRVQVSVSYEQGRLESVIENDGLAFSGERPANARGHGQANLARRVAELGGHLEYQPLDGGTRTRLVIPLEPGAVP